MKFNYQMIKYIIEFEKGVYFCDVEGDPGRTLKIDSAKKFSRKHDAERSLEKSKRDYPFRNYDNSRVILLP